MSGRLELVVDEEPVASRSEAPVWSRSLAPVGSLLPVASLAWGSCDLDILEVLRK